MSNHLGNVLTVINDIKLPISSGGVVVDGYLATIVSTADYSPFGVQLDGRTESAESYRYGFNGMEKESDWSGEGNMYTTEFRMLDARLGRWLSLDPLMAKFPHTSPYVTFANNPIFYVDPFGLEPNHGDPEDPNHIYNAKVKGEVIIIGDKNSANPSLFEIVSYFAARSSNTQTKSGTRVMFQLQSSNPKYELNPLKSIYDGLKSAQKSGSDWTSRTSHDFNTWTQPARDWRDQVNNDAHAAFDNFFSLPDIAKGGGGYFEFNMGGAVGGGISLSAGIVADSYGDWKFYGSFTGNAGIGGNVGFTSGAIAPVNENGGFRVSHWQGMSDGWGASLQIMGIGLSGGSQVNTAGGGFMDQKGVLENEQYYTLEWDSSKTPTPSFIRWFGKVRVNASFMIKSSNTAIFGGN